MSDESRILTFLSLARRKAAESNCVRRQVGAVIVRDGGVVISAANGTPEGCTPCKDGGCARCHSDTPSGEAYDSCICIHAEQRAISLAANAGSSTLGSTMYVTLRPCIPCLNLCLHAGIRDVVYDEEIVFPSSVEKAYRQFTASTGISIRRSTDTET